MEQLGFFSSEKNKPLAYKYRPKVFADFIGQEKAISVLKKLIENNEMINTIIFGPPGVGKTTFAKLIANQIDYNFEYLNAIKSGVSDIKEISRKAKEELLLTGKKTILLFDEIHKFNKSQQDSLLQDLEDGNIILIGSTTENPYYSLNKAIISRCLVVEFKKLSKENIENIIKRIAKLENINIDDEIMEYIHSVCAGDARSAINILEVLAKTDIDAVKQGLTIARAYDDSDKYDRISAMIKSIRGSDENSAVYWLSSMLIDGEDPMYIARRLVISASEDIGLANPNALKLAVAAMQAVEKIGMPECRIILSQCAIYLALSPKSNSAYLAVNKAFENINTEGVQKVPFHLTKAGATKYKYPHDYENHYVNQKYMEKEIKLYEPCNNKIEKALKENKYGK
ncbi:replication-associated recombination protein A [Caviibacter abscessus]|uniref:replication-associated recombination protein A n=1 Tax=Caviibacter abscessus TaxID=1766719 RepID=UPI00082B4246|nr:replication-associated recombination protein A [Caviibacter abscessus]